jgi:hypothetical protein
MLDILAAATEIFAQTADERESAGGDSGSLFIVIMAVIGLLAALILVLFMRARRPEQARSSLQDADRPVDVGGTGPSGRPVHKDPDPDRLAGGRARFTPPPED